MNKRMKDMNEVDREFARQAWVENDWDGHVNIPKLIELVRADEREECAKVCDELHPGLATKRAAEIIRARGQA
jgi:hypothetical protein